MPAIRCKACGRLYDYAKQGMCPKCGAYNRPPRREYVDPDGTIRYVDREAPGKAVRPRRDEKVCYEEKTCYENQVRPSFVQRVQAVRSTTQGNSYLTIAVVVALLLFIGIVTSVNRRVSVRPEPTVPLPTEEDIFAVPDLGNNAFLVEYQSSWEYDLLTNYDSEYSDFCYPGYRFFLLDHGCYVSALTLEGGTLTVVISGYPEDAEPPELLLTLGASASAESGQTIPYGMPSSFSDETYYYDLFELDPDLRSEIVFLDLQIPLSTYDPDTPDLLIDISDILPR